MAKRLYSLLTIGSVLSGTLYVVACGGNSGGKKPDAKIILSDSKGDAAAACSAAASYSVTFGSNNSGAYNNGSGSGYTENLQWQGALSSAPQAFLDLEAYSGGGSGSGGTPDWPTGNVSPKSGLDFSSPTLADVYMLIGANLNGSGQAQDLYLATAGILNITQAGGTGSNFAGNANGLEFTHIVISGGQIMQAPDGCMSSISSMSFSSPIVAAFAGKAVESAVPSLKGLTLNLGTVAPE